MTGGYQPRYSPRFRVEVGGRTFQEPGGRIADLVVETTLDGADRFSFSLHYPFDEELGQFSGLRWTDFEVGTDVAIGMGYGGDGTLTPLLTGKIDAIEATFDTEQGPTTTVSGFGLLHETMQGTHSDSWRGQPLGTVVEDVLSPYPFSTVEVEASYRRETLVQDNQSDYRFLQGLARTYGFEFDAERETVRFVPSGASGDDPVAELWYGEALHDFHATIRETGSDTSVEIRSWDPASAAEIVATAGPSDATHTEVFRVPATTKREARRIAEQKHAGLADGVVEGHGEADGTPAIRAGTTVELAEMGERFSGTYAVTEATHRMGSSGYRTTFEATEVTV